LSNDLEARLYTCLASRRWAQAVASGEPADDVMDRLTDDEWLEAMKAHPRVGDRGGDAPKSISVDVAGADAMTLVVDYADRGDELDHADWLDARLTK